MLRRALVDDFSQKFEQQHCDFAPSSINNSTNTENDNNI